MSSPEMDIRADEELMANVVTSPAADTCVQLTTNSRLETISPVPQSTNPTVHRVQASEHITSSDGYAQLGTCMRHHVDGLAHQGAAHALCATSEDGYALPCINSDSITSTWVGGLPRASGNHGRSQSNLTSVYGMEAPFRNRSSITTWTGHPINTHCTAAKAAVPSYPPAPFSCNTHFTPGLNNLPSTVLSRLEAEQSPRAQLHSTSWHALPSYRNMHTVYGDAAPGVGSIPPVNSVLTSVQEPPGRVPNSYDAHRQWAQISNGHTPTAPAAISEMRLSSTQIASRQVINKDLPTFSGKPEEWPLFITSFEQSTEQCGFTDSENLIRLQRCLKGVALEAVRGKLMAPATVWQAIETLRMLYGRPDVICHSLQRKLRQEPLVRYDKLETLIQFALAVQNYCCTLKAIGLSSYLNDPMLLSELLCKLPSDLKLEWGRYRVSLLHADISEFDYWLFKLATCASQVVSVSSSADEVKVNNNQFKKRVLVHGVVHTNSATSSQPYCLQCSGDHRLEKCKQFCDLSTNDRWCFVRDNKLCIRCFRKHFLKNCPLHSRCGIDGCTKPHHVLLHSNYPVNSSHKAAVMLHKEEQATKTLLRYVPVVLYGKSKCIKTYALIDEGSTCTLLEKHIAEELGLDGPSDELCLRWTGDITQVEPESKCVTIGLSSTHETSPRFNLRNIRTVASLDLPKQSLLQEVLSSHSHLHNLPIEPYAGVRATLLLGVDNAKLGVPLKVKEIEGDQLIATKCRLGWSVYGRGEEANALSNRVMHICSCVSTERMDEMLKANYALEAVGISKKDEPLKSKADERALAIMQSTTKYLEKEKRWETGLLWKFDKIDLPNSYSMALQRLSCLEKRMTRDPLLRNFLNKQIREYEDKGYIRKLTKDEISHGKRSWFIPIFTVTNKNKNKTRLVWDAAATVDGIALNTYLMKGPDLLASLVGILIRFRERAFAITGDIREMFHQIRVRSKDQTAQQFLWRHGNSSRDPDAYVMTVMTFGAACSPSLANFIKNKNASRFVNENASAVEAIHRNMYVDDWLQSVDTEKELIDLALQVKHIHGEGGFEMRNWLSNSTNTLHAISRTAKQSGKLLQDPSMTYEKVLGIWWLPWSDELTFFAKFDTSVFGNNSFVTKRSVLRVIMSVYDPLGLIGFFMIQAKIIMQNIWRSGVTWDAPVQKDEHEAWQSWVRLLPRIHDVRIPRCYPLASFTHDVQLHIFCDASSVAYAAAAYLRATVSGKVKCCLVASKSRVAPLKPVSIPRLELMGAILGLRLAKFIRNELTLPISEEVYWTDSKNVLHWIRSDTRKFSQFVGVRIGEILESSSINNWRWVPSADNVADDATKLKQWSKLDGELRWFQGPQFLTLPSREWPETILVNSAEHELVNHIELNTTLSFTSFTEVVPHVSRFSKWEKLRGATRYALRFLRLVSRRPAKSEFVQMMLQDTTVNSAEVLIVLMCQSETFGDEIKCLHQGQLVSRKSSIFKCSAFIDEFGLLRIKGRIDSIEGVPVSVRRPIILPSRHPVTLLIIDFFHRKYHHHHSEVVVNEIRQKYWVSGLRALVGSVGRKCQVCRIRKAVPQPPQMGSLPPERLALNMRPFTYTGVDFFGPIDVVVGRHHEKRWGVLFTCLTVRAVHIEITHSLSTDAFLLILKQFICRRGAPRRIISDNATNFRGASRILQAEIERISSDELQQKYPEVEWRFIPPAAPHMGGAWERMIRSVKSILSDILRANIIHEHILRAALADVENVLNSRPLTYIPLDTANDEALTPNHFLLGGSSGLRERSIEDSSGATLRKNFRVASQLADQFWRRWVREYLPNLTRRAKWYQPPPEPVDNGDVVIIVDETSKRNTWIKGMVVEVLRAKDGQARSAIVKTIHGLITRPIVKLAKLDLSG